MAAGDIPWTDKRILTTLQSRTVVLQDVKIGKTDYCMEEWGWGSLGLIQAICGFYTYWNLCENVFKRLLPEGVFTKQNSSNLIRSILSIGMDTCE